MPSLAPTQVSEGPFDCRDIRREHLAAADYLEPWMPDDPGGLPWRPMSRFKQETGEVDPERLVFVFDGRERRDVVKSEYACVAETRGGAKLDKMNDAVRDAAESTFQKTIKSLAGGRE